MPILTRLPVFREDGTIEIPLTQGYVALIDADDAYLAKREWFAFRVPCGKVYAAQNITDQNGRFNFLHREVMRLPPGVRTRRAHLNGNPLDCRRSNLRVK